MENQLIPSVSKDLKFLNDINQVVKKSFLRYFVARNGIVFTDDSGSALPMGYHFSFIEDMEKFLNYLPIPEQHVLMLDSRDVYLTMRDHKKLMQYIRVVNDTVFIAGEKLNSKIGKFMPIDENMMATYSKVVGYAGQDPGKELDDELIEAMIKNEVISYGDSPFSVRMTKTLFPHIKVGLPISINFFEVEDPKLFQILIRINKSDILNFHLYTCIKY